MNIKLLREIVASVVGASASAIVDLLYNKKNVNEFLIAKKLKITINQTRNILYKLSEEGIVSFIRKKDRKKGGWYIYFWTLNPGKSLAKYKQILIKNIDLSVQQIGNRKNGRYYNCANCRFDFNEDQALVNNYTCPECGEVLLLKDMALEISSLEKEKNRFERILLEVNAEAALINEKESKSRLKKAKAEQLKKTKENKIRRRALKKIRDKKKSSSKFEKHVKKSEPSRKK
jgi:transcription factor E